MSMLSVQQKILRIGKLKLYVLFFDSKIKRSTKSCSTSRHALRDSIITATDLYKQNYTDCAQPVAQRRACGGGRSVTVITPN